MLKGHVGEELIEKLVLLACIRGRPALPPGPGSVVLGANNPHKGRCDDFTCDGLLSVFGDVPFGGHSVSPVSRVCGVGCGKEAGAGFGDGASGYPVDPPTFIVSYHVDLTLLAMVLFGTHEHLIRLGHVVSSKLIWRKQGLEKLIIERLEE